MGEDTLGLIARPAIQGLQLVKAGEGGDGESLSSRSHSPDATMSLVANRNSVEIVLVTNDRIVKIGDIHSAVPDCYV